MHKRLANDNSHNPKQVTFIDFGAQSSHYSVAVKDLNVKFPEYGYVVSNQVAL